ncbi:MAG: zinc-dependent metalloprotease [Solirubrobacterales bacterium]
MSERQFVDWTLAQRIAVGLAGEQGGSGPFGQRGLESACTDAVTLVTEYTGMHPGGALPDPELIDRSEWARLGLRSLRDLSEGLERRISDGIRLPGPLAGLARSLAGAAAAAEAGVAVGYGARKVLGQYDVSLVGADRPPRLVFVGPNLASAHAQLGENADLFLRWIAIHETTHSVQFASVPWLRSHLVGLLARLLDGASGRLDQASVSALAKRLFRSDPRAALRAVMQGELPRLLAGPEQEATLDALQVVMSVIEGHAEHVMDAAAESLDPGYARLRARLDARRASRGGLAEVIARLLGMELKLRQYRLGKAFCDAVVTEAGTEALNRVWRGPEALPTVAELERPLEWLRRTPSPMPA